MVTQTSIPATQSFHTVCIVKDYIRERERRGREMFVPLTREYLKLCVWRSAHAVKTGHLLNRSG